LSFHKPTGQYYVTRAGKRIYLGVTGSAKISSAPYSTADLTNSSI
jgi:hypothetical protein